AASSPRYTWDRRAWYIWPHTISVVLIGWLFVGVLLKPIPWAAPQTQTPPTAKAQPPAQPAPQRQPDPQFDETICSRSNLRDALNVCTRLIDAGRTEFYFRRAQIYFRNGDYDGRGYHRILHCSSDRRRQTSTSLAQRPLRGERDRCSHEGHSLTTHPTEPNFAVETVWVGHEVKNSLFSGANLRASGRA